ncbi:MAG: amino acid permease, partial [Sciscionella sp.]
MSVTDATGQPPGAAVISEDDKRLHEMGYPRVLLQRMSAFEAFSVPFGTISILTGPITLFLFAMTTGGPQPLMISWIVGGPLALCVAVAMGRIGSRWPAAGAIYYWTAKMSRRPITSWIAAWLNGLGKIAGTTAAAYSCALFIGAFAALRDGFTITPWRTFWIFVAILALCALVNAFAVTLVGKLNALSAIVHVGGALVLVAALVLLPHHHQSVGFVFGHFENQTGFSQSWYVWFLSPLTLMYTMTGIDSAGDMAENTVRSQTNPSRAMIHSVLWSWVLGGLLIFAFCYAIQDYQREAATAYGVPPAQIIVDAIGGSGATFLLLVLIAGQLFCVMACFTASPRMAWALARDKALPFSKQLGTVARNNVPRNALAAFLLLTIIPGLATVKSPTFFYAVTAVSATGLFVSYGIAIFLSVRRGSRFEPGPWNPRGGRAAARVAVGYIAVAAVLICLPTVRDFAHWRSFNYTPIALVGALLCAVAWRVLVDRGNYRGPVSYGTAEQLAALEKD